MAADAVSVPDSSISSDADEDLFQEENVQYNFRELMDQVAALQDCIITVPSDQVELLKAGLIVRKSKDNAKLKAAGLLPDNMVLAFLTYPAKKDGKELLSVTDVRVKLRNKRSVTVLDIRQPDDL